MAHLDSEALAEEARRFQVGNARMSVAVRRIQVTSLAVYYKNPKSDFPAAQGIILRFLKTSTDFDERDLHVPSQISSASCLRGMSASVRGIQKVSRYFVRMEFAGLVITNVSARAPAADNGTSEFSREGRIPMLTPPFGREWGDAVRL